MTSRNTTSRWGSVSRFLHWLVVALVLVQVSLGIVGKILPKGPTLIKVIGTHKSIGITILAIAITRLLWRWMNPVPALPRGLGRLERGLAHFTHVLLYAILFAMPLTGWIGSTAHGIPVNWFGLFQLPNLVGKDPPFSAFLNHVHFYLAYSLGAIVLLHVAGALRHHFVLGDDTLNRMLGKAKESAVSKPAGGRL